MSSTSPRQALRRSPTLPLVLMMALSGSAWPDDSVRPVSNYDVQITDAQALLKKAIDAYREQGDTVLAAISRQGAFTTPDSYVYVIDTQGVMLASGGPSAIYIGRDIRPMLDAQMAAALEKVLTEPDQTSPQSAEYHWQSWTGKRERKRVFFQRIGDKVFAAGYSMPRSSPQEARRLLDDALQALRVDAPSTLERINRLDSAFNRDDLYVFVIQSDTVRFVAHGVSRNLVGTELSALRDPEGKLIGPKILASVQGRNDGEATYGWRNPVTGRKELKHTLLKRQGPYIIAVGYYSAL